MATKPQQNVKADRSRRPTVVRKSAAAPRRQPQASAATTQPQPQASADSSGAGGSAASGAVINQTIIPPPPAAAQQPSMDPVNRSRAWRLLHLLWIIPVVLLLAGLAIWGFKKITKEDGDGDKKSASAPQGEAVLPQSSTVLSLTEQKLDKLVSAVTTLGEKVEKIETEAKKGETPKTATAAVLTSDQKVLQDLAAKVADLQQERDQAPKLVATPIELSPFNGGLPPGNISYQEFKRRGTVQEAEQSVVLNRAEMSSVKHHFSPEEDHPKYVKIRYLLINVTGVGKGDFVGGPKEPQIPKPAGFSRWEKDDRGSWMVVK